MKLEAKIPIYTAYRNFDHAPLALGMIVAFAKQYKGGKLNEAFDFIPGLITSAEALRERLWTRGAGVILCSDYLWSSEQNLLITKIAKAFFPASVTVHGGPSVPKYDYSCEEFLQRHPYVDVAVHGAGEVATAELLELIAAHGLASFQADHSYLSAISGIAFRSHGGSGIVRTPERPALKDLDVLPSPYLTGEFNSDDAKRWRAAIVETNRGCPYGCTFCDWGSATLSKVRQFSLERVQGEIEWIARNGIGILWIADANFGIFARDVQIAETIAACRRAYGYPKHVLVSYAKNATDRLARIVGILHDTGIEIDGIIAIQTRDPQTLEVIERSNIRTERYDELIEIFARNGLPISSDLMMGLPGSTPQSFKADLQFFFDRKVEVKAYDTHLLPNSPMAHRDYIEKYRIRADSSGKLISTYSYSAAEARQMRQLYHLYKRMVGCSVLKYLLYYLQAEHRIKAIDFLEELGCLLARDSSSLRQTQRLLEGRLSGLCRMSVREWTSFYDEINDFIESRYAIADPALKTVLAVQAELMPAMDRRPPGRLEMEHDFVSYFETIRNARNMEQRDSELSRPLVEYGPGILEINDPHGLCGTQPSSMDEVYDNHHSVWELASALKA